MVCEIYLDVPEGCVILREHIPITNLFTCLWFNEVDRFTARDQLSFSTVRDKIRAKVNWNLNMFLDCERRNFVIQVHVLLFVVLISLYCVFSLVIILNATENLLNLHICCVNLRILLLRNRLHYISWTMMLMCSSPILGWH